MKLNEYLQTTGMSALEFSKKIGIDVGTIRNIIKGYDPKLSTVLKIEEFTHKAVKYTDLAPTRKREPRLKKSDDHLAS
jgi:predicted transcriptional regulator